MAPPRLRAVLRDYRPPSAACQVLPSEPLPLGGDGDDAGAVGVCICVLYVYIHGWNQPTDGSIE